MSDVTFHVEQNGQPSTMDGSHIATSLKGMGYPLQGVSADGQTLTMGEPDGKGSYQVKTPDALKMMGYTVKGMTPTSPDTNFVDDGLSALLQKMPDDPDMRKSYIEAKMKGRGIDNPQVTGMGNEWHVFNPTTSQWIQVTRDPHITNLAGLYSAGLAVPHLLGMGLGGAAGGGAAGPVGAVAGAGLGSAAGEALTQEGIGLLDPDYQKALHSSGRAELGDIGLTGAGDAAGYLGGQILGKALPLLNGAGSRATQKIGQTLSGAGELAQDLGGRIAKSELASNMVGTGIIPGAAQADLIGMAGQAPGALAGRIPEVLQWASKNPLIRKMLSEETADSLAATGEDLLKERPQTLGQRFQAGAEELAQKMGKEPAAPNAADDAPRVLGNLVDLSRKKAAYLADSGHLAEEQAARNAGILTHTARAYGIQPADLEGGSPLSEEELNELLGGNGGVEEAQTFGQGMADKYKRDIINSMPSKLNYGDTLGRLFSAASKTGRGLQDLATAGGRGLGRGAQALGYPMEALGRGMNALGTVTQPLELPTLLRYGAPAAYNWWEDRQKKP